jgi:hypothetical protein
MPAPLAGIVWRHHRTIAVDFSAILIEGNKK